MKIVDFKATPVALPMEAPLRHSAAVHPGRCIRTILQVFTDEGIVGVGELEDVVHQRQLEILRLLAHRMSNKEIGGQLFISPVTVKRHVQNVYEKLSVHGRREAVAKATGLGIL